MDPQYWLWADDSNSKSLWHTCFEHDLCHAVLWVKFPNIQNFHGLFPQLTPAERLDSSLGSLWTLQIAPSFLQPLLYVFSISIQPQELLHNLQRVQNAHHPNIDVGHSMFSEIDDFIFDVFREGLVTDPKNRLITSNFGLRDPSIMQRWTNFWALWATWIQFNRTFVRNLKPVCHLGQITEILDWF